MCIKLKNRKSNNSLLFSNLGSTVSPMEPQYEEIDTPYNEITLHTYLYKWIWSTEIKIYFGLDV